MLTKNPERFSYNRKKILVIDDESYNCKAVFQMIKSLKLPNVQNVVDVVYSGK